MTTGIARYPANKSHSIKLAVSSMKQPHVVAHASNEAPQLRQEPASVFQGLISGGSC